VYEITEFPTVRRRVCRSFQSWGRTVRLVSNVYSNAPDDSLHTRQGASAEPGVPDRDSRGAARAPAPMRAERRVMRRTMALRPPRTTVTRREFVFVPGRCRARPRLLPASCPGFRSRSVTSVCMLPKRHTPRFTRLLVLLTRRFVLP
jgi:hypothetical protein